MAKKPTTEQLAEQQKHLEQLALAYSAAKSEKERVAAPLIKKYDKTKADLKAALPGAGIFALVTCEVHVKATTSMRLDEEALVARFGAEAVEECKKQITSISIDVFPLTK